MSDGSLPLAPEFTEEDAFCGECELVEACERRQLCYGFTPKNFNGLMIVGEGPGQQEINEGRPFVGRSGQLLQGLMEHTSPGPEDVKFDDCYLTNATLCKPPHTLGKKGSLNDRAPNAVYSCWPRLEAEIAHVKPRVILALGNSALAALTGREEEYIQQEHFDCEYCAESVNDKGKVDRKVMGVKCTLGTCGHIWEKDPRIWSDAGERPDADSAGWVAVNNDGRDKPDNCPECNCNWKRLKVRRVPCPKCAGRKIRKVQRTRFVWDYKIGEIAGAVIPAEKYGWDKHGVKYIVATYHPSFVLRQAKSEGSAEKKVMAGQFAAYAVRAHIRKAGVLLKRDMPWEFDYEVTAEKDDTDAAAHLLEFIYGEDGKAPNYAFGCDIETQAFGTRYHCNVCGKVNAHAIVRTAQRLLPCQGKCKQAQWHKPREVELDARVLEQVSLITCIGFANRQHTPDALVVDTRNIERMPRLRRAMKRVLTDAEVEKTFHHGTYDSPVIERIWGYQVAGYFGDTLIAHHVAHSDETHSLAHLAFRYTYAPVWKPPKMLKGREAHDGFDELAEYNARDVVLTSEAEVRLCAELDGEGLGDLYEADMLLQEQALSMQRNGLPLDHDKAIAVGAESLERQERAKSEMCQALNEPEFNPNSPGQLREALFVKLGNPIIAYTDGGKSGKKQASTAKDVLVKLPDSPFKRSLLDYRAANSVMRDYFDVLEGVAVPGRSLNLWDDGRIHGQWKPFGARTGRWTSSPNFQNWQKWLRAMVAVASGRKIVGADYDQLELRGLAALSGDPELCARCLAADGNRKLEPEHDPHSYVASLAFGSSYTKLHLKDPMHDPANERCKCQTCQRKDLRELCKRVIYGLNYGAGAETVLASIYKGGYSGPPITIAMIEAVKATIFEQAFTRVPVWHQEQLDLADSRRELRAPLSGRRREFPLGDIPGTEIKNFPIQALGADIMNPRSTEFYYKVGSVDPTAMYLAQVHDAIYYEVAEDKADEVAALMTETLSVTTSIDGGPEMVFSAVADISTNWTMRE